MSKTESLHKLSPELYKTALVESSVERAKRKGEKVGTDAESKLGAFIGRLEELDPKVQEKVLEKFRHGLTIQLEDVPESYWKQQEQLARDNGQNVNLNDYAKKTLLEQLQGAQQTGLNSWVEYLEHNDHYPMWFKVYALEGMTKLGVFDQEKGSYGRRGKGTVAPYPKLSPAALAKTYDMVQASGKDLPEGNFNKIYSAQLLEEKAIIPTPENPEDVQGEWREYTGDDIEGITQAAQGTPWCIAGEIMAKSYTESGGKFLLFHLKDPETGTVSPTASASIRLSSEGVPLEISGLKGGSSQHLEDALVSTVEEKVRTLRAGESYLQAFKDRQTLIEMDKKFQAGVPFTEEEIFFLYETERRIRYLDTYDKDPRPAEFRRKKDEHMAVIAERYGEKTARTMLLSSAEVDRLMQYSNRKALLEGDEYDLQVVLKRLPPHTTLRHIREFVDAGAKIDADDLITQLKTESTYADTILEAYDDLAYAGATLTPDEVAANYNVGGQINRILKLKKIGAHLDVNELIGSPEIPVLPDKTATNVLLAGGDPNAVADKNIHQSYNNHGDRNDDKSYSFKFKLPDTIGVYIAGGLPTEQALDLIEDRVKDVSWNKLYTVYGHDYKEQYLKDILRIKDLDLNAALNHPLLKRGYDGHIYVELIPDLLQRGVNSHVVMDALGAYYTSQRVETLVANGVDINDITEHVLREPKYAVGSFDTLNKYGANLDFNDVVRQLTPRETISEIVEIGERGAKVDINAILDAAESGDVYPYMIKSLIEYGADHLKIANKIALPRMTANQYGVSETSSGSMYDHEKVLLDKYPEIVNRYKERVKEEKDRVYREFMAQRQAA